MSCDGRLLEQALYVRRILKRIRPRRYFPGQASRLYLPGGNIGIALLLLLKIFE